MSVNRETYRGTDGGCYPTWAVDESDTTPIHTTYPTGYESDCTRCYLNQSHTEAEHVASKAFYRRKV